MAKHAAVLPSPVLAGYWAPQSSSWSRECTIWRWNAVTVSNSGGCLKSLNTASPRWWPFKWNIWFVRLKLDAFFSSSRSPCWTCVANSNDIVLLCHREKLLDLWRHVHKWWCNEHDTSWESLQFKAGHLESESGWISDKSDWLIDFAANVLYQV